MTRQAVSRIALCAALAVAIAVAYFNRGWLDAATLQERVASAGAFGSLVYMAIYVAATVLFLPGSVITLAGGALFGPAWGTLYSLAGATLGATIAFLIARYLASAWINRRAGGWMKQLMDGVEEEGWRFVAFARLMPLFPFNLLNYALGLTRIRLIPYVVASWIFMLPGAIAYTYLGYVGREAVAGGQGLIRKGLLALALLAVVAFLPRLVKRFRKLPSGVDNRLSCAELRQRLDRHEDIKVLDVRSARDYAGELGHVPGSLNIPLDDLSGRLRELEIHRERPIAVICRTNRMSGRAVQILRDAGFKQALLVDDGMVGWAGRD
ncbi:MAG: VTT domain-containing protein [Acidiferrobacterales bacterium]